MLLKPEADRKWNLRSKFIFSKVMCKPFATGPSVDGQSPSVIMYYLIWDLLPALAAP